MKKHSIGNDIVALDAINNVRTCQPRFYSKFLIPEELRLFERLCFSLSRENFTWLCWTIKESVYKFCQQLQPQMAFAAGKIHIREINAPLNPQALQTWNDVFESNTINAGDCFTSLVVIGSSSFYSYSFITEHFIYTITANKQHSNQVYWGIKKIKSTDPASQSIEVRRFTAQKLAQALNTDTVEFVKSGIPQIRQYPHVPVSFSHHDKYVAYAFLA